MNDMRGKKSMERGYLRFFAMIGVAIASMFLLMYTHSYRVFEHAWFSETRLFMALVMGGAMMVIMLSFMLNMYTERWLNIGIFVVGFVMLIGSVWLVRSQNTVDGVDYMEGMIPHHSIAILTSERAAIEDPRVRKLADEIIESQKEEITEMEWLIRDIRANGIAETEKEAEARKVPSFSEE
jgi:hypothetical protein